MFLPPPPPIPKKNRNVARCVLSMPELSLFVLRTDTRDVGARKLRPVSGYVSRIPTYPSEITTDESRPKQLRKLNVSFIFLFSISIRNSSDSTGSRKTVKVIRRTYRLSRNLSFNPSLRTSMRISATHQQLLKREKRFFHSFFFWREVRVLMLPCLPLGPPCPYVSWYTIYL